MKWSALMNWFKKLFLYLAAIISAMGFIAWSGCAVVPITASRTPITARRKADFNLPKGTPLTKEQVIAKLGKPDAEFGDLNVVCYKLNQVKRNNVILLFFVVPVGVMNDWRLESALIHFNARNEAEAVKFITEPSWSGTGDLEEFDAHEVARKWVLHWPALAR
ncbi:MAG: hypothetical protein QM796_09940 [Chthoniobacteraceae bacterium]